MARNAQAAAVQDRRMPDYVVRAPDPHRRGRWITLGAAWETTLKDGQIGYSIKLNTLPVGNAWDGTLVLLPPIVPDEQGEKPE